MKEQRKASLWRAISAFGLVHLTGCAFHVYSPKATIEHTYLGSHQIEDLVAIPTVVAGKTCNEYVPFIGLQEQTATAKDALDAALVAMPEAVALVNVSIEERTSRQHYFGLGNLYEYCIFAFGTPLVPRDKAETVRARLREANALLEKPPVPETPPPPRG